MKQIVITSLLLVICAASGWTQNLTDKVYFDEDWNMISNASKAKYYRLYNANDQTSVKPFKDYYISGNLKGVGYYTRLDKTNGLNFILEGERTTYFENGNIECKMSYVDGNLDDKVTYYNDSTGKIFQILNFKNNKLDGRQVKYSPDNENEIWKEDYFDKGLMKKEITYQDGNIRKIITLLQRDKESFIANVTYFLTENEDSLLNKQTVDFLYNFDPDIWKYPFQLDYLEKADFNGRISQKHGKCQDYDYQGRIISEEHFINGQSVGLSRVYNYKQNAYAVWDNDDHESCTHYYTLDNQPFTGKWDTRRVGKNGCIGNCVNGLMEGCWIQYDEYSRKIEELNFINGVQQGNDIHYYYNKSGECIWMWVENYVDGKLDGLKEEKTLSDEGEWETYSFFNYKNGILDGEFQDYKDSLLIIGSFKDGELDGYSKAYCIDSYDNTYLFREGTFKNGKRVGEWTYRYPDENYYEIQNYTDNEPDRFFSYSDDTPFSGTIIRNYYDEQQKHVYTIKKSFIQQIDVYDAQTGKQTNVIKFKNGLPVYK